MRSPFFLLAALILLAPQLGRAAVVYTVNSSGDAPDATGNGVCETAPGNGVCTLRAAVSEANAIGLLITTEVHVPAITIDLSLGQIIVSAPMKIIGAGMSSTVIEHDSGSAASRFIYYGPSAGLLTLVGMTIRGFTFLGNSGGAIVAVDPLNVIGCAFELDSAYSTGHISALGGAIATGIRATLTIQSSIFRANHSDDGGAAITVYAPTVIQDSIFEDNTGGSGTILSQAALTIDRCLFTGNSTNVGGAIYQFSGQLRIYNTTITGNSALDNGGGIDLVPPATARIFNSTIASNDADSDSNGSGAGGGLHVGSGGSVGDVQISNSILAGNTDTVIIQPGGNVFRVPRECNGHWQSMGYNMLQNFDSTSCTISGSFTATDPQLQPLSDNGGFSATRAIGPGSPALDAGNPNGCLDELAAPITRDQRGSSRPFGAHCDLGAFEYGGFIFSDDFEIGSLTHWSKHVP